MLANPAGLDGFEFVEFSAPEKGIIEAAFVAMGFCCVAHHRSKDAQLWRQGGINFITNYEPLTRAWHFSREHGPGASGIGFRVHDAAQAYAHVIRHGAEPVACEVGPMELKIPGIRGVGGATLYLVDRYDGRFDTAYSIYDVDFRYTDTADRIPAGCGLHSIDHVTHSVQKGRLNHWDRFYSELFNFREIRNFDVQSEYIAPTSRAMIAPDDKIRIPLNEEGNGGNGQVDEFLRAFNGEGIQHIALACDDLVGCWDKLQALGVPFMSPPPATYFDILATRLPGHEENSEALRRRGILLDGSTGGGQPSVLLQIFAEAQIGPLFFEFIQRKGDQGFGEGNYQALFESI